jgi:hypothetical protein
VRMTHSDWSVWWGRIGRLRTIFIGFLI